MITPAASLDAQRNAPRTPGRHAAERTRRIAMKKQHTIVALVGSALASATLVTAAATTSNAADTNAPVPPSVHKTITGWQLSVPSLGW